MTGALPEPLPAGHVLAARFCLGEVLGRGGFATTYSAEDMERGDACVVKELTPQGSVRLEDGRLSLGELGAATAQRLRRQFVQEAELIRRLNVPGVLPVRSAFVDAGTAYYVTELLPDAMTLERVILQEGRMDPSAALDVLFQLLETLEHIHSQGILHRDIKPSNILLNPAGRAYLIDFGSAREWHRDLVNRHTVEYTPGYAPPEQLSEVARRGPATDLYGLCATAYRMLTTFAPPPAGERQGGTPLPSLGALRPDVEPNVAQALEAGLALRYEERPQSAAELRELLLLEDSQGSSLTVLEALDERAVRLAAFHFDRRQCPSCGGVLEAPKPLRRMVCPVCRSGMIQRRRLEARQCPVCMVGALRTVDNNAPLAFCPTCGTGRLRGRPSLPGRPRTFVCEACQERYAAVKQEATRLSDGRSQAWHDWRVESGRSERVEVCDSCDAQLDHSGDGRWRLTKGQLGRSSYSALYPDEWARVSAGLEPGVGNAECPACGADYHLEEPNVTLLEYHEDVFGFGAKYHMRLLAIDSLCWMAVGKTSGARGQVCAACHTEFDDEDGGLELVATEKATLARFVGQQRSLGDWHRVAQGLPEIGREEDLQTALDDALKDAYRIGEIPFDAKNERTHWRGRARQLDSDGRTLHEGKLLIGETIGFSRLLKRFERPVSELKAASVDDGFLQLAFSEEVQEFQLEPLELLVNLKSGRRKLRIEAEDVAARLMNCLNLGSGPMAQGRRGQA